MLFKKQRPKKGVFFNGKITSGWAVRAGRQL